MIVTPATYRKGYSVIHLPSNGSSFKTRAMEVVERLGGQWVHRYRGYVVPSKRVERIERTLRRLESMFHA